MLLLWLAASVATWVPARWTAQDPQSLELLAGTPINCLLMEKVSPEFLAAASSRGLAVLLTLRPEADLEAVLHSAVHAGLSGLVLEGAFEQAQRERARRALPQTGLPLIELPPRAHLRLDRSGPILGSYQGLWPGIRVSEKGVARAAPTGSPWLETNTGFLRYLRAATDAPIWIANRPPAGPTSMERYLAAVADAAIIGARWVVALDPDFDGRLQRREAKALAAWKRIAEHLKFYEDHPEWRNWKPSGQLAIIIDGTSGALLANGIVDMIAVRHVPLRVVPRQRLSQQALQGARIIVSVDPAALDEAAKQLLRSFTRAGATLLSGPPGWKFPAPTVDQITLDEKGIESLGEIWREVNSVLGRRNLGARLFNVAGMLSHLLASPDGAQLVLHLANFTSYPVENITVHLPGSYTRARLLAPGEPPRELALQQIEEGVAIEIERVSSCAALLLDCKR